MTHHMRLDNEGITGRNARRLSLLLLHFGEGRDLGGGEVEVKRLQVTRNVSIAVRRRNGHHALLRHPPQRDLRSRDVVRLGHCVDGWVAEHCWATGIARETQHTTSRVVAKGRAHGRTTKGVVVGGCNSRKSSHRGPCRAWPIRREASTPRR